MNKNFLITTAILGVFLSGNLMADEKPIVPQNEINSFSAGQIKDIEKLVGNFIRNNPDVVVKAIQSGMEQERNLAVQKMEKAVADNRDKLLNDKNSPVVGNPMGKQTLTVFLDPVCGYCKKFHSELEAFLKKNKNLKVVMKDIPILGPSSHLIVQALFSAKEQGKYQQFHHAVINNKKELDLKQLLKIAASIGLNTKKFEADIKSDVVNKKIEDIITLATTIGVTGTPTLIINGKKVIPGYVPMDELEKLLADESSSDTKQAKK